jgi:hypothetical protein
MLIVRPVDKIMLFVRPVDQIMLIFRPVGQMMLIVRAFLAPRFDSRWLFLPDLDIGLTAE